MFRKYVPALVAILLNVLLVPSAMAVYWYTQESPLKVYEDKVAQGAAYGNFSNDHGVKARSYGLQKDLKPGGQGIYVETKFLFYGPNASCGGSLTSTVHGVCWYDVAKRSTTNTTAGSWQGLLTNQNLRNDASQARGDIKICENHSWASDPCSDHVLRTFSY